MRESDAAVYVSKHDVSIIDAHCDTLLEIAGIGYDSERGTPPRDFFQNNDNAHLDLPKLLAGQVRCQFMALFCDDAYLDSAYEHTLSLIDIYEKLCAGAEGRLFPVLSAEDLSRAVPGEKVGTLLSIEGAEALGQNAEHLPEFYTRGVRAVGLTWNRRNAYARGVKGEGEGGLTEAGHRLVEQLEAMHLIIDASHLSDEAFWDLARQARRPFIASHSNARAVFDHPRNLTDQQIRAIADSGGAVGVVFVPNFISDKTGVSYLDRLVAHIDHIIRVGGIACAALGSDFDGFKDEPERRVLADASQYPQLLERLSQRGYTSSDVEKIAGGNWECVIRDILQ